MKQLFLIITLAAPLIMFGQQRPFTLKGSIVNFKTTSSLIKMYYHYNGKYVLDSTEIDNGSYIFKGSLDAPVLATVINGETPTKEGRSGPGASFFLEPGNIAVKHVDSFSNTIVSGSMAQVEFAVLKNLLAPLDKEYDKLSKEFKIVDEAGDQEEIARYRREFVRLNKEKRKIYGQYFNMNPESPLALYALEKFVRFRANPDEIERLYNKLTDADKKTVVAAAIKEKIESSRPLSIGKTAPDFTQNDTSGTPVKLSSFRGKYVLIDFWASWCKPCRAENPNLVNAFHKYKDKNFTILGVSLDNPGAHEKWVKAIRQDGLTWTQVSDLMGWKNAVVKSYMIRFIPQNLLIDPQGKIVAKNLKGEALHKTLAELLQSP